MIYWFTGQPAHGKTTLALLLVSELRDLYGRDNVHHIDGDDIRLIFDNRDYSIDGRKKNVELAQSIAHYLSSKDQIVIVSMVSPYRKQRENFKKKMGNRITEFYIHTSTKRQRENYKVKDYEEPLTEYIDIDTTTDTPTQSIKKILKHINIFANSNY